MSDDVKCSCGTVYSGSIGFTCPKCGKHSSLAPAIGSVALRIPVNLHPSTQMLVIEFAEALAEKLAAAEAKYGYSNGWADSDWMLTCQQKLLEHVAKGDPRDVAAYCAFMWHHHWPTSPQNIDSTTQKP